MQILTTGEVIFGRFKVLALVNGAGQSFGYHASDLLAPEDKPWLREVYLKQYHDLIPGTEEALALSSHFSALRSRLGERAGYICLPLDLGEVGNSLVAAYPWIEGSTLRNRLEAGLTHEECVRLAMALTQTVRIMHKQGIAHLDLKPENVVVERGRKDKRLYVRMIDLDAAQIDGAGLRRSLIGTEGYMSPEHIFPGVLGSVSAKSDIFALGIMIYELLFHSHPFLRNSDSIYRENIMADDIPIPDSSYHRDVVGRLVACLATKPDRRPQAGWVQATFTEHYKNLFVTDRVEDFWIQPISKRVFVQLESPGSEFRRAYFEDAELGRSELRGLAGLTLSGTLIGVMFDRWGCYLVNLSDSGEVRFNGLTVGRWERARVTSELEVGLGNAIIRAKVVEY